MRLKANSGQKHTNKNRKESKRRKRSAEPLLTIKYPEEVWKVISSLVNVCLHQQNHL